MFCPLCGNQISKNHKFCYKCGNPSPGDTGCSSKTKAIPKPQSSASDGKLKSKGTGSTPTFEAFQATKTGTKLEGGGGGDTPPKLDWQGKSSGLAGQ